MIKRFSVVFVAVVMITLAQMVVPAPAGAVPAPPPCLVSGPGSGTCVGNVTFSSYYLSTVFRPFQGVAGAVQQPNIYVYFTQPGVRYVRAWANDPDFPTSKAWVHLYGCCWLQFNSITGDGDPAVFSVGGGYGLQNGPFDAVRLESAAGDYVNWRVEYQTNINPGGPFCKVTAQSASCQGVTATVSPYAQGSKFDPFQGTNNGTGVQAPIDVTFQYPAAQVAVTALDPDLGGNRMEAYAANGALLGTAYFDGDSQAGFTTWSTKSITVANISRVRLIAADNDYTVFQGLMAWPMGPLPLEVSINGPGFITVKGTYTFTASYANFNPNPTFSWSERFCDGGTCSAWLAVGGNSATFTRTLTPDCSGTGENSFELQLVMRNSDGRTATANHNTWLCGAA